MADGDIAASLGYGVGDWRQVQALRQARWRGERRSTFWSGRLRAAAPCVYECTFLVWRASVRSRGAGVRACSALLRPYDRVRCTDYCCRPFSVFVKIFVSLIQRNCFFSSYGTGTLGRRRGVRDACGALGVCDAVSGRRAPSSPASKLASRLLRTSANASKAIPTLIK